MSIKSVAETQTEAAFNPESLESFKIYDKRPNTFRHALLPVLTAFVVTRSIIFFLIYISTLMIPMKAGNFMFADPFNPVLDGLIRDDSWWYHNIITQGYSNGGSEAQGHLNVTFLPLYPLVVKLVGTLLGNFFLTGVLVSNFCFLIALFYLYSLAEIETDRETASKAVFYLAAAPTAVFFSAMYTESLYILLVICTFYYSQKAEWKQAAVTGALAAATRNTGILLVTVIVLEGLHQSGWRFLPTLPLQPFKGRKLVNRIINIPAHLYSQLKNPFFYFNRKSLVAAAFIPIGLLAYMIYLANTFGDPLAFITGQSAWGRDVSGTGISQLLNNTMLALNVGGIGGQAYFNPNTFLDLLFTICFGILVFVVLFRMRPAYGVYSLATFLTPLFTGSIGSMTRYILMLIPCFILLAKCGRNTVVDRIILAVFLPLLSFFTILFSHWYFAG